MSKIPLDKITFDTEFPSTLYSLEVYLELSPADFEKLFSFQLSPQGLQDLAAASEAYVVHTLSRRFNTLDFYNQVKTEV